MRENQLSRYGAISKSYPMTTGKAFFLVSSTETSAAALLERYAPDGDGLTRVYTDWASVITACQVDTGADVIIVSPLFTTAPTIAQIDALNAAGVVTIQAGSNLPDGSYLATKAAAALDTATTVDLFQVNGRIKLLDIIGEVATTIGATASGAKFLVLPTVGSTTDLCATTNIASLAVGGTMTITGTLATALTASVQGAIVAQTTPLLIKAGKIQLNTTQTTTGNVRYRVRYIALDPGAFVSPL